jgi:hypothetical protein
MKQLLIRIAWFVLLVGLVTEPAWADCLYKGTYYPTGTRVGTLTCQPDGTWK